MILYIGKMLNNRKESRKEQYSKMRSLVDYTMGLIYISMGAFLLLAEKIGYDLEDMYNLPLNGFRIAFATLFIVYGVWRFYRGIKKQY